MGTHASTVLVVEDERKIRDLVRGYLEREGLGVLSTESGADSRASAIASAPDSVERTPRPSRSR